MNSFSLDLEALVKVFREQPPGVVLYTQPLTQIQLVAAERSLHVCGRALKSTLPGLNDQGR